MSNIFQKKEACKWIAIGIGTMAQRSLTEESGDSY